MLIRIIPVTLLFIACDQPINTPTKHTMARMNSPKHSVEAKVTPLTAEMEVEYLPSVEVVALHDEVQIEYIPSAE